MSVAISEYPICWAIAHAQGNPDGASEFDEWLRTATCVRDNLMEIQGQVDGFCGEAAYVLAHLIDGNVVLGSYQFGGKPSEFENPHYWVEKEGYIIDPTAEQYGEFEGPIVIKIGDKHYVYTEDTFRDDPSEVRRLLKRGFIEPAISMRVIEDLLKANCTAGIGLSKRSSAQGLVIEGWHSSPTGELGISDPEKSTEGVGYYIALERETAQFFGRVVEPVSITLFNPLDARGEPAYILLEEDEVMEAPKPGDSEWLSAIKEAVSRSGTTDENWGRNQAQLNQALTDVLQKRGYDGILIEDWAVKFASPGERAGLEGYLKSEIKNPDQARVIMDSMSLTLTKEEKEDYDHFVNDATRKIYVFLRAERDLTHESALEHLEEYAQWGEIPGVTSPLGRGEPVDNEIRALFGLPPIKDNPARTCTEIREMAMNQPFIHVDQADVKETFIYDDHPVAIVDVFEFGGMWNPENRLIMFDSKTWGMLNEEEKRILLDHEIIERGLAMEDYARYRSHSAAVEANHAKANSIVSERYGADVIDDLIARGLLAK